MSLSHALPAFCPTEGIEYPTSANACRRDHAVSEARWVLYVLQATMIFVDVKVRAPASMLFSDWISTQDLVLQVLFDELKDISTLAVLGLISA